MVGRHTHTHTHIHTYIYLIVQRLKQNVSKGP